MALFTPWKLSSQKLGFFLVTFGFIWGMMLLHFTIQQGTQHESSSVLREQILDLSKQYIKALAEENRNVMDGPYVGTMTAYGGLFLLETQLLNCLLTVLPSAVPTSSVWQQQEIFLPYRVFLARKTLAVLLDNILQRIGKLESKVDNLVINGTGANSTNSSTTAIPSTGAGEKLNVAAKIFNTFDQLSNKDSSFVPSNMATFPFPYVSDWPTGIPGKLLVGPDIINGAQEHCELPPMDGYPHCEAKTKWMKDMWRSDVCYSNYGVDGSTCSFFIYLSEVSMAVPLII
ncbi:hypothetical protein XELAEV_18046997mg [Xenopus laevis]|uniref:MGT5A-like N-terminal domain-containing protein n=1 Tax=Xenopus laevis TaxID=8355 RepID=A0A974BUD8_XENLA|nr:hypothetical protein XELAEV_18046997mg [Xenopus laevis]